MCFTNHPFDGNMIERDRFTARCEAYDAAHEEDEDDQFKCPECREELEFSDKYYCIACGWSE